MTLDTGADKLPIYNEPLKSFDRDVVPRFSEVVVSRLDRFVQARIELENSMFLCGIDPPSFSPDFTELHAEVLLKMLIEFDSPPSVRWRAQSAIWAGNYKIKEAIPILREMVLDEDDDLQTRLNAIPSFVEMTGDEAYNVIERLLQNDNPTIRIATYRAALRDRESRIAGLALEQLKREEDRSVFAAVVRRSAVLQERYTTTEAPHGPVSRRRGLKGCFGILFGKD
jgi:hypothetical protein